MSNRIQSDDMEEIRSLLQEFVKRNSHAVDIQWDPRLRPRLPINPHSRDYRNRNKVAHYFLLVASIDESKIIGRAENARRLLVHLYRTYGHHLLTISRTDIFENEIRKCKFYNYLGPYRELISSILVSVNKFVRKKAKGDIIRYSQRFSEPKDMVDDIAKHVERFRGRYKEKLWIYMRWMVRPKPDLRIFDHFLIGSLSIPLTTDIINIAVSLGLMDKEVESSWWKNEEEVAITRNKVTQFAKQIFPEDPAKVDYPFFLLGRWLRGRVLTQKTLRESLQFFNELYKTTGYPRVVYQVMSRYRPSGWDKKIRNILLKMGLPILRETIRFPLSNNIFYTPDFIIEKPAVNGRKIVLEPHGKMREAEASKFTLFRRKYEKYYFLMLIVRNNDIPLVPKETYDDIWPIEYVDILLHKIKNNQYKPLL